MLCKQNMLVKCKLKTQKAILISPWAAIKNPFDNEHNNE